MKKWQYEAVLVAPKQLVTPEDLNKLGKKGWELVAAIPVIALGVTHQVHLIFKREMRPKEK